MRCITGIVLAAAMLSACSVAMRSTATAPVTDAQMAQLWIEPDDIAARDLFWGPGGRERAPAADTYRVTDIDNTGFSRGYDAVDSQGRAWKIKLGVEAQSEAVASRVLWAIGFHQPATYVLERWKMTGGRPADQDTVARFRSKDGHSATDMWSWQQNPFVGTREFKGLVVAQLVLNNWDFKTTNNRVYTVTDRQGAPRTWFVVQDLGAALGKTGWPTGNRSNVAAFEQHRLVDRVTDGRVIFDYHGRHREILADVSPSDVVWTCRLLSQLTDAQWRDAFRAGAYPDGVSARFVAKIQSKIQEGLALMPQSGIQP